MKVLVATDQYLFGEALAEYLFGQQICACALICCVSSAIDEMKREEPDFVILDLEALPYNGLNMITSLHKAQKKTKLILLLTGKECSGYILRLLAIGVWGILSRNSSMEDLASCFAAMADVKVFLSADAKQMIVEEDAMVRDVVADINALTKRELQIALLIATGITTKEVAGLIHLSVRTVNVHRHNILRKLKLKKTIALINLLSDVNSRLSRDPWAMAGRRLPLQSRMG